MGEALLIKGNLGPIKANESGLSLDVRPLTVFIGEQGTGKSLISQILYFFRNLPFLARYYAIQQSNEISDEKLIRVALDNLRSDRRAIAVFGNPNATVKYGDKKELGFGLHTVNSQVIPRKALLEQVNFLRSQSVAPRGNALFVPAERVLYAHAKDPTVWDLLALPSTLKFFASALESAGNTFDQWDKGIPATEQGRFARELGLAALKGEVEHQADKWFWRFDPHKRVDIDMASSGQKANWPLVLLAEALFDWREQRAIGEPFYLHVEEPEIHLHPAAQVAMVKILAYLVNQGFRVTITTHSLTVLYVINNLMLASELKTADNHPVIHSEAPIPELRLSPERVSAYVFRSDGQVQDLVDREEGFINETELGRIGEQLSYEMNFIGALRCQLQQAANSGVR